MHPYQGQLTFEELLQFVHDLGTRINHELHQSTGKIPIFEFKKERNPLLQLPTEKVRDSYRIKRTLVKVNASFEFAFQEHKTFLMCNKEGYLVCTFLVYHAFFKFFIENY